MSDSSSDIVIKGGSVHLNFDHAIYAKDDRDPKAHRNDNRKITRIVITGDLQFDSGDYPDGLKCTITAHCQ